MRTIPKAAREELEEMAGALLEAADTSDSIGTFDAIEQIIDWYDEWYPVHEDDD